MEHAKCKPAKKLYNPLSCRCITRDKQTARRLQKSLITDMDGDIFIPPVPAPTLTGSGKLGKPYVDACLLRLQDFGFAVADTLLTVSDAEAAAAARLTAKYGAAIFEHASRYQNGNYRYSNGTIVLKPGTKQRKQLHVQNAPHVTETIQDEADADTIVAIEKRFAKVAKQFAGTLPLADSVVIVGDPYLPSVPGQAGPQAGGQRKHKPGGPQLLHADVQAGVQSRVVIVALSDDMTLLVAPFSHVTVRGRAYFDHLPTDAEADEIVGMIMPRFPLIRLRLKRGQLIVMDGNTVHAGDAGQPHKYNPCMHWYAVQNSVGNATQPLAIMGPSMEASFVPAPVREPQWW